MQNFYIYSRVSSNKKYFYVNFVDEETKEKGTAKSIDALARAVGENRHITKKTEAYEIAQKAIIAGICSESITIDRTKDSISGAPWGASSSTSIIWKE